MNEPESEKSNLKSWHLMINLTINPTIIFLMNRESQFRKAQVDVFKLL